MSLKCDGRPKLQPQVHFPRHDTLLAVAKRIASVRYIKQSLRPNPISHRYSAPFISCIYYEPTQLSYRLQLCFPALTPYQQSGLIHSASPVIAVLTIKLFVHSASTSSKRRTMVITSSHHLFHVARKYIYTLHVMGPNTERGSYDSTELLNEASKQFPDVSAKRVERTTSEL